MRPARHFVETDKWVTDEQGFISFWENNGGLAIFGLPVTGAYAVEGNLVVQYFERARFEYHADSKQVLLGRVGAELLELQKTHQAWFNHFKAKGCT